MTGQRVTTRVVPRGVCDSYRYRSTSLPTRPTSSTSHDTGFFTTHDSNSTAAEGTSELCRRARLRPSDSRPDRRAELCSMTGEDSDDRPALRQLPGFPPGGQRRRCGSPAAQQQRGRRRQEGARAARSDARRCNLSEYAVFSLIHSDYNVLERQQARISENTARIIPDYDPPQHAPARARQFPRSSPPHEWVCSDASRSSNRLSTSANRSSCSVSCSPASDGAD